MRRKPALAGSALLVLLLSGCAAAPAAPSPTPDHPVPPTPVAETGAPAELTREPDSQGFCGVIDEFFERNRVMSALDESEQVAAFGINLDFLANGADRLADAGAAPEWRDMARAFREAGDFHAVSGGNIANDDFLYLVALAVDAANKAYEADADRAQAECGQDLRLLKGGR